MKTIWKVRHITAKTLSEFSQMLEKLLNSLEEEEFKIIKIENMKNTIHTFKDGSVSKSAPYYYTVVTACKNPSFPYGPNATIVQDS